MRFLAIPLLVLALNVVGTERASADPPAHSNARARRAVPELEGNTLPAALVLLAGGATLLVVNRRKRKQRDAA